MNATIKKTYDFAFLIHNGEKSGHDFRHIERVFDMCLFLAQDYPNTDLEMLQISALLHDVDDYKLNSKGVDRVGEFLRTLCFNEEKINRVKKIISLSSFSNGMGKDMRELSAALPIEAKMLSDSDKLDAMGAEGIIRTFNYGNKVGQPVFLPDCLPRKNLTIEDYRSDKRNDAHSIAHFFDKLLKLKDMMFTEKAKIMAQQRHEFMLSFLREFFTEEHAPAAWFDLLERYSNQ